MTLASWTGIEAGIRRQLESAAELQEKLGGVLASLDGRIADLQAAVESAVKAAEAIPVVSAPSPRHSAPAGACASCADRGRIRAS